MENSKSNFGIDVKKMTDEHLLEELSMIIDLCNTNENTIENPLFDYMLYCRRRYQKIFEECRRRHLNVQNQIEEFSKVNPKRFGLFPLQEYDEKEFIFDLMEKIDETREEFFHYAKELITKQKAKELICQE